MLCKFSWKDTFNVLGGEKIVKVINEGIEYYKDNFNPKDEDKTVSLSPLLFDEDQPVGSKIKFNEDRSIATRVGEEYCLAYLNLRNTLRPYEFILIQILKVDHQNVGSLRLYHECIYNGERTMLFADSKCERYDYIIFWMDKTGQLFCKKDERIHNLDKIQPNEAKRLKLICELYGLVQQIRAYVGHVNTEDEKTSVEVGTDVAANCSEESKENTDHALCSNNSQEVSVNDSPIRSSNESLALSITDGSNSQLTSPEEPKSDDFSLRIKIHGFSIEEITVNNLPTMSATCSDTDGTSNYAVETCKICMDVDADTVIIPCGHLVCCYECTSRISTRCGTLCPMCRTEIKTFHKVYSREAKCEECEINPANVILLPCGDLCLCDLCSTDAKTCPVCHMFVNGYQKVI